MFRFPRCRNISFSPPLPPREKPLVSSAAAAAAGRKQPVSRERTKNTQQQAECCWKAVCLHAAGGHGMGLGGWSYSHVVLGFGSEPEGCFSSVPFLSAEDAPGWWAVGSLIWWGASSPWQGLRLRGFTVPSSPSYALNEKASRKGRTSRPLLRTALEMVKHMQLRFITWEGGTSLPSRSVDPTSSNFPLCLRSGAAAGSRGLLIFAALVSVFLISAAVLCSFKVSGWDLPGGMPCSKHPAWVLLSCRARLEQNTWKGLL